MRAFHLHQSKRALIGSPNDEVRTPFISTRRTTYFAKTGHHEFRERNASGAKREVGISLIPLKFDHTTGKPARVRPGAAFVRR